jgi:hypothetical protein
MTKNEIMHKIKKNILMRIIIYIKVCHILEIFKKYTIIILAN